MVWPFLDDRQRLQNTRWARYANIAPSLFELVSLEDSDYAVLPYPWHATLRDPALRASAIAIAGSAATAGKELLAFDNHDDDRMTIDLKNTVAFRTSLRRSARVANEFAQPAWADDLLQAFGAGRVSVRRKRARPTVTFCGYAPPNGVPVGWPWIKERARAALGPGLAQRLGVSTFMRVRARAIDVLRSSSLVDSSFVFRNGIVADDRGGTGPYNGSFDYRGEFVENVLLGDYVLCTRGWGNFSFRLYEILCLGRIPLFVDTDCVLPADDAIDWKSICVWVPEPDLDRLPSLVLSHYDGMSDGEFAEQQRLCRQVWETVLSPHGFFRYLQRWLLRRNGG
jgi:hypothetical protein